MKKKLAVIVVLVALGIGVLVMLAPPNQTSARGWRSTPTSFAGTLPAWSTRVPKMKTPTAQWTPIVSTIVPGPTITLLTRTPTPISRAQADNAVLQ